MKIENVKHTPGPWKVHYVDTGKPKGMIDPTYKQPYYQIDPPEGTNGVSAVAHFFGPDSKANAKLGAAAPDMLTALKRLDKFCSNNSYPKIQGIWQDAIDAIAKAEGRA